MITPTDRVEHLFKLLIITKTNLMLAGYSFVPSSVGKTETIHTLPWTEWYKDWPICPQEKEVCLEESLWDLNNSCHVWCWKHHTKGHFKGDILCLFSNNYIKSMVCINIFNKAVFGNQYFIKYFTSRIPDNTSSFQNELFIGHFYAN